MRACVRGVWGELPYILTLTHMSTVRLSDTARSGLSFDRVISPTLLWSCRHLVITLYVRASNSCRPAPCSRSQWCAVVEGRNWCSQNCVSYTVKSTVVEGWTRVWPALEKLGWRPEVVGRRRGVGEDWQTKTGMCATSEGERTARQGRQVWE